MLSRVTKGHHAKGTKGKDGISEGKSSQDKAKKVWEGGSEIMGNPLLFTLN